MIEILNIISNEYQNIVERVERSVTDNLHLKQVDNSLEKENAELKDILMDKDSMIKQLKAENYKLQEENSQLSLKNEDV